MRMTLLTEAMANLRVTGVWGAGHHSDRSPARTHPEWRLAEGPLPGVLRTKSKVGRRSDAQSRGLHYHRSAMTAVLADTPAADPRGVLQDVFGYGAFRGQQQAVVEHVIG